MLDEIDRGPLFRIIEQTYASIKDGLSANFLKVLNDNNVLEQLSAETVTSINAISTLDELETFSEQEYFLTQNTTLTQKYISAQHDVLQLLTDIKDMMSLDSHAFRYTFVGELMKILVVMEEKYPAIQQFAEAQESLQIIRTFGTYFFGDKANTVFEYSKIGDHKGLGEIGPSLDILYQLLDNVNHSYGTGKTELSPWKIVILISKTSTELALTNFESYSLYALNQLKRFDNNSNIELEIVESHTFEDFADFYDQYSGVDAMICIGHGADRAEDIDNQGFIFYDGDIGAGPIGEYINEEYVGDLIRSCKCKKPKFLTLLSCANANWDSVIKSNYYDYFITSKNTSNDFAEAFCHGFLQGLRDTNNLDLALASGQLALLFKNNGAQDNFQIHKSSHKLRT